MLVFFTLSLSLHEEYTNFCNFIHGNKLVFLFVIKKGCASFGESLLNPWPDVTLYIKKAAQCFELLCQVGQVLTIIVIDLIDVLEHAHLWIVSLQVPQEGLARLPRGTMAGLEALPSFLAVPEQLGHCFAGESSTEEESRKDRALLLSRGSASALSPFLFKSIGFAQYVCLLYFAQLF